MMQPDYQQNSIVNLMASLGQAMGYDSGHPSLSMLDTERLKSKQHIILWVIDGLGYKYLQNQTHSFLWQNCQTSITSVFPSTTATAISTFMTAQSPAEHGITGWFMYLARVGMVSAVLPYVSRAGKLALNEGGLHIEDVLALESWYGKLDRTSYTLSPAFILDSPFNMMATKGASREGFKSLQNFEETLLNQVKQSDHKSYHYAYWSELDAIGHQRGIGSDEFNQHFSLLDQSARRISEGLAGSDTTLLICADHGQINTDASRVINISTDHVELAEMLLLPLCGEPRAAYCYVRPGCHDDFVRYINENLADKVECYTAHEMIADGWYGDVQKQNSFLTRIGDFVLIPKSDYVIKDRLPGEHSFYQIGTHGGASEAEMLIPLIPIDC